MGDNNKKDAETSTSDLSIEITKYNLDKFETFLEQISRVKSKFTELEDVVNLIVSEKLQTINELIEWRTFIIDKNKIESQNQIIKSDNSRMEERFELLEKNNQIKLKMMIQELEMSTKLTEIKRKYNYLDTDSNVNQVFNQTSNVVNTPVPISQSAPMPPPPPPPMNQNTNINKQPERKSQKELIAPASGTDVQSQLKAALASKFKNANG
jgi:hypothetical protein